MQLLSILLLLPTVTVAFRPITTSRIIGRLTTKQQLLPDLHDSVNHINTVTEHLQLLQSLQHSLLLSVDETATEAVSAYSKVDKTGFIGFFATYIEIAIDFGRSIFQKVGVQNGYGFSIILFTMLGK